MPEGHAVLMGNPPTPLFVVRTYHHAALVWPLSRVTSRGVSTDAVAFEEVSSLYWLHYNNLDFDVLELAAVSPLRLLVIG